MTTPVIDDTAPADSTPPEPDSQEQNDAPGIPFEALLIQEGVETSDDRFLQPNALTWRELPLPMMAQLKSEHGGPADTAASVGGRIDTILRAPLGTFAGTSGGDGFDIIATGMLDAEGEVGLETARLIAGEFLRGVSADLAVSAAEVEITAVDDDGYPIGERFIVTEAELGMATITPFPAFADCQIRLLEQPDVANDPLMVPEMPEVGDRIPVIASIEDGGSRDQSFTMQLAEGCLSCEQRGTVVAAGGPLAPPADWFEDPHLPEPTAPMITDDGRTFGHLAPFDVCHTGSPAGSCILAPRNGDYSYFHTGAIVTDDGATIPVGQLTLAGGHADLKLGYRAALQHYDDTDSAIADVCVGEDAHGVWFAGALRPGVTDEQIRVFLASPLSGDWRPIGAGLKLVAACSVNVQGFPIRRARVAAGQPVALIASGPAPKGAAATAMTDADFDRMLGAAQQRQTQRQLQADGDLAMIRALTS